MVSLGFYWSLLIFHFTSFERTQFWSQLCHYLTAIIVLSFSWICNLHRICCVVLITHDFANVALQVSNWQYRRFKETFMRWWIFFFCISGWEDIQMCQVWFSMLHLVLYFRHFMVFNQINLPAVLDFTEVLISTTFLIFFILISQIIEVTKSTNVLPS